MAFYQADSGQIKVFNKQFRATSSRQSIEAGIGMVHQHFMLVDNFTVLENVILGSEGGALITESLEARLRIELTRLAKGVRLRSGIRCCLLRITLSWHATTS